jgi:hypothetical protein
MLKRKVPLHFVNAAGRRAARKRHPLAHWVIRLAGKTVPFYEAHR